MGAKILLVGENGQVGWELKRCLSSFGNLTSINRNVMDLTKPENIRDVVRSIKPTLIVNAAAYTNVNGAEDEPDIAHAVNAVAPGIIAEEAMRIRAGIIHYSTDYVYDGAKNLPYTEEDDANPLSVYGKTKWKGDLAIQASGIPYLIFRTSWVYGARGKNFMLTILRLSGEREEITIVDDQIGTPTWSRMLAEMTAQIISRGISDLPAYLKEHEGIYNMTADGKTSWYGFAREIIQKKRSKTNRKLKRLVPVTTEDYPAKAPRPAFSVLDNTKLKSTFGLPIPAWEECLDMALEEVA